MRTRDRSHWVKKHAQAAKKLLRGVVEFDPQAMERYHRVFVQVLPCCLMRCQHVIAHEAGFSSWAELLQNEVDHEAQTPDALPD